LKKGQQVMKGERRNEGMGCEGQGKAASEKSFWRQQLRLSCWSFVKMHHLWERLGDREKEDTRLSGKQH